MPVLSSYTLVTRITEKISTCFKIWEKANVRYNQCLVSPFLFCLYLREKVATCHSPAPIEAAVYAVRWAHEIAGANSPTECTLVKQVLEDSKRLLCKPVQGKQSVKVDLVTKVAEKFNSSGFSF